MSRWIGLAMVLLGIFGSPAANATTYAVELPPVSSKAEAEQLRASLASEEVRIVRRYARGQGWTWVVMGDGYPDLDAAQAAAQRLAGPGRPAAILALDGNDSEQVALVDAAAAGKDGGAGPSSASRRKGAAGTPEDEAAKVLDAASRALGGPGVALARLGELQTLSLTFDRSIPMEKGELVARNRLVRQGQALRLEVQILKGEGQNSTTVIDPAGEAWVEADGTVTPRDAVRVREVMDRFQPEALLSVPLGLPDDIATAEAWRSLRRAEDGREGDQNVAVLVAGVAGGSVASAAFSLSDHTLARVTYRLEGGEITFHFSDYRRVDRRLLLPFQTRIERDGALIEEVRISEFLLDPPLSADIFEAPGNAG